MPQNVTKAVNAFLKRYPIRKCLVMATGIFFMGFFVSLLIEVDLGTDPFTFMNVILAERLGISFGTWELIFNAALFIPVLIWGRKYIGPGTILNMICIGYIADLCRFIWSRTIPESWFKELPGRGVIFALAVLGFVIAAAVYVNADAGLSPYDACPQLLHGPLKFIPFFLLRIVYDGAAVLVGMLCGSMPNIGHLFMVVLLGPAITLVGRLMKKGKKEDDGAKNP